MLRTTIHAYRIFNQSHEVRYEWEEDTFTLNLVDYIRHATRAQKLPLSVQPQTPIYTSQMKIGNVTPKRAVKIDIRMWNYSWYSDDQVYFAWECKLVVDKPIEKKHNRLVPEYVTKGIVRFLDESWEYASDVNDAGMIGYVLYGNTSDIVDSINYAILNPPSLPQSKDADPHRWQAIHAAQRLSHADCLKQCEVDFVDNFAVYQSLHNRTFSENDIQLYHLFLSFDFEQTK